MEKTKPGHSAGLRAVGRVLGLVAGKVEAAGIEPAQGFNRAQAAGGERMRPTMPEAKLTTTEHGLISEGEGWFVLNGREALWWHTDWRGWFCDFEGDVEFTQIGINLNVLPPGQPRGLYHAENAQEDFLVISGECLLVIEGEERMLKQWDFVHCPPWTEHVLIAAGVRGCVLLSVGARKDVFRGLEIRFPVSQAALKHGAGVTEETSSPEQANAGRRLPTRRGYREGNLPSFNAGVSSD